MRGAIQPHPSTPCLNFILIILIKSLWLRNYHGDLGHGMAGHIDLGHGIAGHIDPGHGIAGHIDPGHGIAGHIS